MYYSWEETKLNEYDFEMYDGPEDFTIPEHWEKRRWYSKYGLSDREEDNLVMDEIEGESKELEK